jgi:hemoglobin/transferrin/lactoferrin receptor protein
MNNAIYRSGHIQNSITIDPSALERTEVIYGPSSVGYGSDALGGVVHYYTKTPKLDNDKTFNIERLVILDLSLKL